jgi:hypothetical protein
MNPISTLRLLLAIALLLPASMAQAHDEGHGPKLSDASRQGGVVAPVIDAKQSTRGAAAAVLYKAELTRSEDGTVRVYFYDKEMKPLPPAKFGGKARGDLEFKKNKKWTKLPFTLTVEDDAFIGKAPPSKAKPFNIDIYLKDGPRELMAAFNNLD